LYKINSFPHGRSIVPLLGKKCKGFFACAAHLPRRLPHRLFFAAVRLPWGTAVGRGFTAGFAHTIFDTFPEPSTKSDKNKLHIVIFTIILSSVIIIFVYFS
jgi:hypothetical protein